MGTKETGRYLKYAIGEVALVMIGILLALSINNWNEQRKQKNELAEILITVKNDLKTDTLLLSTPLKAYKERNLKIQKVLNNEIPGSYFDRINDGNFDQCEFCFHIASSYSHLFVQDKGIELLKNFTSVSSDTLISSLLSFHNTFQEFFKDDNNLMKGLARDNGVVLEKYDWYPDFRAKKYNKDLLTYFRESTEYRNKISTYKYFANVVFQDVEEYIKTATNYIKILEEMFPED